jgi:hypothetical protein
VTTQEDYIQKRKIANDICKRKNKAWLNNRVKEIEEANRRNDSRTFYKGIKSFSKEQTPLIPLCEGLNGDLISEKTLVLQRWKQYFCELLNREDLMVRRYQENTLQSTDTEITIPTYEEIIGIINKLKSNRAPGPNNITAELIKNGGHILKRRI